MRSNIGFWKKVIRRKDERGSGRMANEFRIGSEFGFKMVTIIVVSQQITEMVG
jgi:hypothetical protein